MRANERPRLLGTEAAAGEGEAGLYNCDSTAAPARMGPGSTSPPSTGNPAGPDRPKPIPLADTLARLADILPRLARVLERTEGRTQNHRLTLRIEELAEAIGVSRRVLERELSAGRFPKPDLRIGKMPLWRVETVRDWLERPGR